MKKLFSLIAFMAMTLTAMAQPEGTTVGEDGYTPEGASFSWNTAVDFQTQAIRAEIDLSTCQATNTNENILTIGTDIGNWNSGVALGGNCHLYYTPSTKTLTCHYLSATSSLGTYRYDNTVSNVEGTVTVELSYQRGVTVNGEQIYSPSCVVNLLNQTSLYLGSQEGSTRSWATYNWVRVVDDPFVAPEAETRTVNGKALFGGKYNRYDALEVGIEQTSKTAQTQTIKQITVNGEVLGDIVIEGVSCELYESHYILHEGDFTAKLTNAGPAAKTLFVQEGSEIPVNVDGWYDTTTGEMPVTYTFTLGTRELVLDLSVDEATVTDYTADLTTTLSENTKTYEDKLIEVSNYGDGFADLTFIDVQLPTTDGDAVSTIFVKEVPTGNGSMGATTYKQEGLTLTLTDCDNAAYTTISNATIDGQTSGTDAYFVITGQCGTEDVRLVYGVEPETPVAYTDTFTIIASDYEKGYQDFKLYVLKKDDTTYTFSFSEIPYMEMTSLTFDATGTLQSDGIMEYTCDNVETPTNISGWEDYPSYVSLYAKGDGEHMYAVVNFDLGGFGSYYTDYYYTFIFGDEGTVTGIDSLKPATDNAPTAVYNLNGMRRTQLERGINIVRQADGNVVKVLKK